MALSGSYTGSSRSYGGVNAKLKISWSASQSISGNYSKVTAKLYLVITQGGIAANGDGKLYIGGNSNSFSHGGTYKGTGTHLLKTATETINHSSDGTKSFSLKGSYSNDWWGSISISSKTYTLDTIPRNSKVSSPSSFNLDSAFTITTNRKSSSFTHTLILSSGGFSRTYTGVGASRSITTSGDFESDLAERYPTAKSAIISITCRCYSGSTLIGTSTTSIKANFIESRMRPTVIVPTFAEINAAVLALGLPTNTFIQSISKVSVDVGPMTTKFNAAPSKYELVWGSYTGVYNGSFGIISNAIPTSTAKPTLKGTDSRGFASTVVTASNVNVIPYVSPTFDEVNLKRVNGVEPIIRLFLTANLALVKSNNVVKNSVQSLRWRYALKGSSSWSSWSNLDGYSFNTSTGQLILSERQIHNNLNADNSYDIQIEVKDLFSTVVYASRISKATPTLSIKNEAVAINKQADVSRKGLDVNGDIWLNEKKLGLSDTGWLTNAHTVPSGTATDFLEVRKVGNMVTLRGGIQRTSHIPTDTETTLAILKEDYRPIKTIRVIQYGNYNSFIQIHISSTGVISCFRRNSAGAYSYLENISFFVD